jgi:hypothetical protein
MHRADHQLERFAVSSSIVDFRESAAAISRELIGRV